MNTKQLLKLHDDTCNACKAIMKQKNSDYTGGKGATDVFANFNASKMLGIHPVQGLLLRVIDKIQRIRSFTNDKELSVPNETVEDACDDIVNYAILAKAMLMEERSQIEQPVSKLPTGEEEVQAEKRMNIIGQNGNEGLHYKQTYAVGEGDMP
jgi:hypothetical protein